MDIPPQTKQVIQALPKQQTTPVDNTPVDKQVVDLRSLNLKPEQIYPARVFQQVKTPTSSTNTNTEWLLNINGQLLKVSSQQALQIGQLLQLKLIAAIDAAQPSLAVQVTPPPSPPTTTTKMTNSYELNNPAMTQILKSINLVLLKQITLEQGLKELKNIQQFGNTQVKMPHTSALTPEPATKQTGASSPQIIAEDGNIRTVQQYAKAIENILFKTLPHTDTLLAANKNNANENTVNVVRSILQSSGLFFEASNRQPGAAEKFSNIISQIQKSIFEQTNISKASGSNLHKQGIENIQSALLASLTQTSAASTTKSYDIKNYDIKSMLLSISAALSKAIASSSVTTLSPTALSPTTATTGQETPASSISGFSQFDLRQNPFNFPILNIQQNAKLKSVLTGQELTTGQLLKLLASMINRIHFNQLNSLYQSQQQSSDSQRIQSWFFELPFVNPQNQIHNFNFRLDKKTKDPQTQSVKDKKEIQWTLSLSFDLEQLGPMYVQVNLMPPSVSSTIWADNKKTLYLIEKESAHFKEKLQELGLEVSHISCQQGPPAQQQTKLDRNLVDIKA